MLLRAPALELPETIGGIPTDIFKNGRSGSIETPNGLLHHDFTDRSVWLSYGPDGATYQNREGFRDFPHFSAELARGSIRDSVGFSIRSVVSIGSIRDELGLEPGEQFPGIHAAGLLAASIAYLEATRSRRIGSLLGCWEQESDSLNYAQYQEALTEFAHLPLEERRQRAAFATWTGRQALKHGFTRVVLTEEGTNFRVIRPEFRRPLFYGLFRRR